MKCIFLFLAPTGFNIFQYPESIFNSYCQQSFYMKDEGKMDSIQFLSTTAQAHLTQAEVSNFDQLVDYGIIS